MNPIRRQLLLAAGAALALPSLGQAQDKSPIRILVGFPPGGGTDALARFIAERLAVELGQPVIVENKPGAGGRLAADQLHKVLSGVPAGTIPVVSAESFFQLNYRVARELGLDVSDGLLRQANEVIR